MRVWLAVLLACPAMAQIEARLTGGTIIFADDNGANPRGTVGGAARFYFSRRWSFEPQGMYTRQTLNECARNSTVNVWGNVQFDFIDRDRRAAPYCSAAPGLTFRMTRLGSSSHVLGEVAFGTGAGVRIRLSDRVFFAPQGRLGTAGGLFGEVTGSIGFVLKK